MKTVGKWLPVGVRLDQFCQLYYVELVTKGLNSTKFGWTNKFGVKNGKNIPFYFE